MSEFTEEIVMGRIGVLKVGEGRGFVIACRDHLGLEQRIVITAAHCLEHARLADGTEGLPPCHPWRYLEEEVYPKLLGPLGAEPSVWAACLFVDPIADVAVLGQPDTQSLSDEADTYDALVESVTPFAVADAPMQGSETRTFGDRQFESPTPGEGRARVLSLEGSWIEGRAERCGSCLQFEPKASVVCGMSGSPVIDANGAVIGVVSTDHKNPVIVDCLSARLVRSILAANCTTPEEQAQCVE
jgi:hypothetical protein